jgi:hypothetical protein
MAENIVGGLFGVNPEQLMRQRQTTDANNAFRFAQLSPMERAQYSIYQGGAGLGRAANTLLGGDPEMQKISSIQQLSSQFDLASPDGMRDFARALQPIAPNEAMLAAKRADEMESKTQQIATQRSQEIRNLREPTRTAMTQLIASGKYTPTSIALYEKSQDPADLVLVEKTGRKAAGDGDGVGKLTPAQKAVDTKFSKEYTDFVSAGGSTTITKNLQMLDDAIKIIETEPDGATSGKLVGLSDKAGTISYSHPKAAEAKDLIGGVAQSNLRAVLGGQFAAREGEQLLARAYNTAQPKKDNLNRLKALRKQIQDAADAKINASQYYEENGTLKGFKGNYSVTPDLGAQDNNDPLGLRKK